ncbi:protein Wnt-2-like [Paramormyrops kingsleyae]|uniref:protein Wnt-2-like n=1 Tax=Paramormyrops kingsleyae TaxID=1676925 RepID=UPI003B96EB4C
MAPWGMDAPPSRICVYLPALICCFTPGIAASWWYMHSLGSQVMCDNIPRLAPRQRQLCRQHPSVMLVIGAGIKDWMDECKEQFRHQRWDCSAVAREQGSYRRLPPRDTREVAFMYAVSSAGMVHTLARACSQGELDTCSCDPHKTGISSDSQGSFSWGGCSDNINFAVSFARAFIDAQEGKQRDARALMNLHNNRVGRKAVRCSMSQECKCHGVSGSCAVRTCWMALRDFRRTGDYLHRKYDGAIQVVMNQYGTRFTRAHESFGNLTKNELVYMETSPDYCIREPESGSMGTGGRACNRTSKGTDGCEVMCCGRGYNTARVSRTSQCECTFHWCCTVHCKDCQELVDVHTCKFQEGPMYDL